MDFLKILWQTLQYGLTVSLFVIMYLIIGLGRQIISRQRAPHIRVPLQVPTSLLPVQLPANTAGKAVDAEPSAWVPVTHVGHLDVTLESWPLVSFWPRPNCCGHKEILVSLCHSAFL